MRSVSAVIIAAAQKNLWDMWGPTGEYPIETRIFISVQSVEILYDLGLISSAVDLVFRLSTISILGSLNNMAFSLGLIWSFRWLIQHLKTNLIICFFFFWTNSSGSKFWPGHLPVSINLDLIGCQFSGGIRLIDGFWKTSFTLECS